MGALHSALVAQSNHLIKGSRCLTYRPSDDGVIHVYDEMPALRSHSHEGEAPGSVHVRILWLEIDTNDCQQIESKLRLDLSLIQARMDGSWHSAGACRSDTSVAIV